MMTRLFILLAAILSLAVILFQTFPAPQKQVSGRSAVEVEVSKTNSSITATEIEITSGGLTYPAYFATHNDSGPLPAVVLLHSINGLDPGYRTISDKIAQAGYAVLALQWQTHARVPHDDVVIQLVRIGITFLQAQTNIDPDRIGLTGFCIGGRYTMLLLPQIKEFKSGVAWYGFPYRGGDENQVTAPATILDQLTAPMLIIHGTKDSASPIADIYRYATELEAAGKYFELKVYQGQPHGFMLQEGKVSQSFAATDALNQMLSFFDRTLK